MTIVLNHAVGINTQACDALGLRLQVRVDVHPGGVPPQEERLFRLRRTLHEINRAGSNLFIDRFHALSGQGTGVLDLPVGARLDDAARTKFLGELS